MAIVLKGKKSKFLLSTRFYKNRIEESPGWNEQVLGWCLEAARDKEVRKENYWGGFVIDEMKIQVSQYI